jgi:hypothetical protein
MMLGAYRKGMRSSVIVLCSLVLLACGGSAPLETEPAAAPPTTTTPPAPEAAPPAEPALGVVHAPASPSCANEQIVPRPTGSDQSATYASFLTRNGAGWNATPPSWTWDLVLGRIEFSYRTDAKGEKLAAVSRTDAESAVRAFVVANWDLVGYRSKAAASLATIAASPVDASFSGGGFAWTVGVDSDEPQGGYEDIAGAVQHLHFIVDVADDGSVRQFTSADEHRLPPLTLSTTPHVSLDAARAQVLGLPMKHVAGPYEPDDASFDYGPIAAGDIVATGLALTSDIQPTYTRVFLAHIFTIDHDRYHATLFVDACTGVRLGH